jgi:competence protein ComEC
MSFAAVAGLIAFYETVRPLLTRWHRAAGKLGRAGLYALGIGLTTVVCTVATAPFTIYHFNRFAVYSVAANVVAVPITGFWVMPWGIVSCLLMPLRLEAWGLVPMGWGIDAIAWIARQVTAWPGAIVTAPAMPFWGLFLVVCGGLWLAIWRRAWRLWGAVPIAAGLLSLAFERPPDLVVAGDGRLMAARAADGSYMLSGKPRSRFEADVWTRRAATDTGPPWPAKGRSADDRLDCDRNACRYSLGGPVVELGRGSRFRTDCSAALVVGPVVRLQDCPAGTRIIDAETLAHAGAHAVWLTPALRIESADERRGARPWVPHKNAAEEPLGSEG